MKITLSKKQWDSMGKEAQITGEETTNVKETSANIERPLSVILELWGEEQEYKNFSGNIGSMEEATPEDLEAGYGNAMSGEDYVGNLREPYVAISKFASGDFGVYFYGNASPYSVNAGRGITKYIDEVNEQAAKDLIVALKVKGIPVEIAPVASKYLKA